MNLPGYEKVGILFISREGQVANTLIFIFVSFGYFFILIIYLKSSSFFFFFVITCDRELITQIKSKIISAENNQCTYKIT